MTDRRDAMLAALDETVQAASPRPWQQGSPERQCQGMLSTDDGEYIGEFYLATISTEAGTLPGDSNARLAALDVAACVKLVERLRKREDALPSDKECICGASPHEGKPCSGGRCDCTEYRLMDAEGHELKADVDAALRGVEDALGVPRE